MPLFPAVHVKASRVVPPWSLNNLVLSICTEGGVSYEVQGITVAYKPEALNLLTSMARHGRGCRVWGNEVWNLHSPKLTWKPI